MLDAVIIEPALDKRTNLREIARSFCKSVVVSSSLQDGLDRVRNANNCDVIYVSSRFDFDAATNFVASTKQFDSGRDSANLLIGSPEDYSEVFLAKLTLKGFDGVLVEPASVDTFRHSAELAMRVRGEKLALRKKKSIEMLAKGLADSLDDLALKTKLKQVAIVSGEKFRKLSRELAALDPDSCAIYLQCLPDFFDDRPPFRPEMLEKASASQRLQRRMLAKT